MKSLTKKDGDMTNYNKVFEWEFYQNQTKHCLRNNLNKLLGDRDATYS